jgi:hypothetical protein
MIILVSGVIQTLAFAAAGPVPKNAVVGADVNFVAEDRVHLQPQIICFLEVQRSAQTESQSVFPHFDCRVSRGERFDFDVSLVDVPYYLGDVDDLLGLTLWSVEDLGRRTDFAHFPPNREQWRNREEYDH